MTTARFLVGDVFDRLADIPDDSIDLVMTSPPFLALRSYLPDDHADKAKEIGTEATPADFIETLLTLTAEWQRVLAPHGSIAVELGDTYSGSGGSGGDYNAGGIRESQAKFSGSASKRSANGEGDNPRPSRNGRHLSHTAKDAWASSDKRPGWPLAKSATMIPEIYRVGLAYGINPLTGEASPAGRWRVRNTVRWCRPNPPVGALGDKYRPATSDMVIATKAKDRWFDLDAVRTEHKTDPEGYTGNGYTKGSPEGVGETVPMRGNPAGAPPLDWWNIPTSPYKGSHYATYPLEICRIPILSMCPDERCANCGVPRRRQVENDGHGAWRNDDLAALGVNHGGPGAHGYRTSANRTVGWSDCGCDAPDYQPGVVLDPFAGSGTTLAAAQAHGRSSIGIDVDERNAWLARERVGMFLDIDMGEAAA